MQHFGWQYLFLFFWSLSLFQNSTKNKYLIRQNDFDIKNEIDESEKLRTESKKLLDEAQNKLNSGKPEKIKIIDQAKKDSEKLIIEMNDKFHKSAEIKKNLAQTKINQMKKICN